MSPFIEKGGERRQGERRKREGAWFDRPEYAEASTIVGLKVRGYGTDRRQAPEAPTGSFADGERWVRLRKRMEDDWREADARGYEGRSCYFDRWAAYISGLEAGAAARLTPVKDSAVPETVEGERERTVDELLEAIEPCRERGWHRPCPECCISWEVYDDIAARLRASTGAPSEGEREAAAFLEDFGYAFMDGRWVARGEGERDVIAEMDAAAPHPHDSEEDSRGSEGGAPEWADGVRDALDDAINDWRMDDSCGPPCVCDGDNVALQVLCRAFDDDPADLTEEWRAFDKSGWTWWGRALGVFIRQKIAQLAGAAGAGEQTGEAEAALLKQAELAEKGLMADGSVAFASVVHDLAAALRAREEPSSERRP